VPGYKGSYLLRRNSGDDVEFVTIILWESIDAVRAVAGPDFEKAVIPEGGGRICLDTRTGRHTMRLRPSTGMLAL
jgi:heme-degrading monooxygenase HmoA